MSLHLVESDLLIGTNQRRMIERDEEMHSTISKPQSEETIRNQSSMHVVVLQSSLMQRPEQLYSQA